MPNPCPRSLNQAAALFAHSSVSGKGISELLLMVETNLLVSDSDSVQILRRLDGAPMSLKRALFVRQHIVFTLSDRRSIKSPPLQKEPESNWAPVGDTFCFLLFVPEGKEPYKSNRKARQNRRNGRTKGTDIKASEMASDLLAVYLWSLVVYL